MESTPEARPIMFDIHQIRCFIAVAEELHFGRAAQRLNMTQPPLSRQIQSLEHLLGTQLLERSSRVVRLTPAGRSFLPEAKRILKLADSAARLAVRVADGKAGSVRIGFTASSAYSFLPRLVRACREALPDIELSLREMVSGDQFDALSNGQLDIGLLRPPVTRPGLRAVRLGSEQLVVALPEGHALCDHHSIDVGCLDGMAFVNYSPYGSRYFHDLLASLFSRAGVRPRDVQFLSQIHSILAMVRAGLGIGLVPQAATHLRFEGVTLRPLQIAEPTAVELFLAWQDGNDNPLVPAVADVAKSIAQGDKL
jgi:DNA-binding transcriptional LysR family regulator